MVRSVLTHKRWQGDYIAIFALYGYRKDPADHSRLLPDPEAAAVVRHIFALYLQGYGTARIAHIFNAEGVPAASVYRQQHGGPAHTGSGQWSRATLHQMLTNRTYAGDLEQGRRRKVSYKSARSVRLPRSQWIVVPGTHEGLVSPRRLCRRTGAAGRRGRGACKLHGLPRWVDFAGRHIGDIGLEAHRHVAGAGRWAAQMHGDFAGHDHLAQHVAGQALLGRGAAAAVAGKQHMGWDGDGLGRGFRAGRAFPSPPPGKNSSRATVCWPSNTCTPSKIWLCQPLASARRR